MPTMTRYWSKTAEETMLAMNFSKEKYEQRGKKAEEQGNKQATLLFIFVYTG